MPPLASAIPSPLYCTQADLESYASVEGVRLRADDDGDGQINAQEQLRINYAIYGAAGTVQYYLSGKYDPYVMQYSFLVFRWSVYLALFDLFGARANPEPTSIIDKAQDAQDRMEEIAAGRKYLEIAVPLRRTQAPTWSNVRVDVQNFQFRVIRVEVGRSSKQPNALPVSPDWAENYSFEI